MRVGLLLCLALAACTVKVEVIDPRISREEIAKAFAERDQAIGVVAQAVKGMQEQKESKK